MQPRPPPEAWPCRPPHRGVRAGQQLAYARATGHAMAAMSANQEWQSLYPREQWAACCPYPQPPPQDTGGTQDHSMLYYYGQIHMYEQNGGPENQAGCQAP